MQLVNGYVCQTCSDVTLAKAGKDPAHPNADKTAAGDKPDSTSKTGKSNLSGAVSSTDGTTPSSTAQPAVTFGGVLSQYNDPSSSTSSTSSTAAGQSSGQPYSSGSAFNVLI